MPTPKKGPRFGGSPAHQKLILSNLVTQLFEHGRITTTEAKARQLRPLAEKLITKAKKAPLETVESLHNRRIVLKTIKDKGVVHVLFTEIAEKFKERPGGYTRITKLGPRKGDNADMAVIELVDEPYAPRAPKEGAPNKKAAPAKAAPVAETAAEEVEEVEDTVPETEEELAISDEIEEGGPLVSEAADEAADEAEEAAGEEETPADEA